MEIDHLDPISDTFSKPENVISVKVANLLATSYGDSSVKTALTALDSRISNNNSEDRRNLRASIESQVIKNAGMVLKEYSKTASKLQVMGQTVNQLNQVYQQMDTLVQTASKTNSQLIDESDKLNKELVGSQSKLALLKAFEDRFIVSNEELDILSSTGLAIDEEFFQTLDKVKRIHNDCSLLMTGENTAGTGEKLMERLAGYLDRGYEKLSFHVQKKFRSMQGMQNMRVDKQLRKCLILLTERPSLFQTALTGLCEIRQKDLSLEFVRALSEESSTNSKPIDFYAYDILRYVGDIMAWLHSAVVGEKENLEALFESDPETSERLQQGRESEPWTQNIDIKEIIESEVDKITKLLAKPLRIRIERAISAQTRPTTVYQVLNILKFYENTFQKQFKLLKSEPLIIQAIKGLEQVILRQFNRSLEAKITSIRQTKLDIHQSDTDLQPPDFLFDATADVKTILTSYEASINYTPGMEIDNELKHVIQDLVEPYLECCNRMASDMPNGSAEVFMINCYDTVMVTLLLFPFASFKIDQLDVRIGELRDVLIERISRQMEQNSGIADIDIENKQQVQEISSKLDEFLPSCSIQCSTQLQGLTSPNLAEKITSGAFERFLEAFKSLKDKIIERYGVEEGSDLVPRTTEQLSVLLGIH